MRSEEVILLVEDNEDDADLALLAFAAADIANPIARVRDGQEALDYLFGPQPLPVVVLLDLKLPRLSGLEVLQALRGHARTKRLPVVVLTSSREESDRLSAYENHANSYVCKPIDYEQFVQAARHLGVYWTEMNVPPPAARG